MLKNLKILSVLIIFLLILGNLSVFATDINMNLTSSYSNESYTTNNTIKSNTNTTDIDIDDDFYTPQETMTTTSTVVTSSSSLSNDDGLSLGNILNILLIVVGIVLILLGIAVLIRIGS